MADDDQDTRDARADPEKERVNIWPVVVAFLVVAVVAVIFISWGGGADSHHAAIVQIGPAEILVVAIVVTTICSLTCAFMLQTRMNPYVQDRTRLFANHSELRQEMRADREQLQRNFTEWRQEMTDHREALRKELKDDRQAFRGELQMDRTELVTTAVNLRNLATYTGAVAVLQKTPENAREFGRQMDEVIQDLRRSVVEADDDPNKH